MHREARAHSMKKYYRLLLCSLIPLVAAANLACELAEVDPIQQSKYSFLPCFLFNLVGVLLCVLFGLA